MRDRSIPIGIAIAAAAVLVLAGMFIGAGLDNLAPEAPLFERVQADSAAVVRREPDNKITLGEKLTAPAARPVVRATAAGAARNDVLSFCAAAGYALSGARSPAPAEAPVGGGTPPAQPADTSKPLESPPSASLPPIAFPRSGIATRRSMEFWSVSSSGDLERAFYRVRYPVTWRADGDSLIVQSRRFGLVRELVPIAPCAAGGALSGKTNSVLPAAIGCVLSAIMIAR